MKPYGAKFEVINEQLIRESVNQLKREKFEDEKKRESEIDENEPIEYKEIEKLVFSFKALYKISNLEGFSNLKILLLDNNNLTTINNLNYLTNLRRIDLSFNRITNIPKGCFVGLSKLENLSLFENEIKTLENMEDITNLKCLNVSQNKLEDKQNIRYLRQFKRLRSLSLRDNPLFEDRNYKNNVLEFLSYLTFLDHRLVLKKEIDEARGRSDSIKILEDEERREKKKLKDKREKEREFEKYKRAGIQNINQLFKSINSKTPEELDLFAYFTKKEYEDYLKSYNDLIKEFKKNMFDKEKEKRDEIKELEIVINEEKEKNMLLARKLIKQFERNKKITKIELEKVAKKGDGMKLIKKIEKDAYHLGKKLQEIEVNQNEAFNDVIDEFVENFKLLDKSEIISTHFKEIMKIDKQYSEDFRNEITELIRKKNEKLTDPEKKEHMAKILPFLDDKEQLMATLMRAGESRMEVIYQREEVYLQQEKVSMEKMVEEIKRKEHERNRLRVFEIWSYMDRVTGKNGLGSCEVGILKDELRTRFETE